MGLELGPLRGRQRAELRVIDSCAAPAPPGAPFSRNRSRATAQIDIFGPAAKGPSVKACAKAARDSCQKELAEKFTSLAAQHSANGNFISSMVLESSLGVCHVLSSGGTSSLLYQTVPPLYQSAVPLMYQGPAWDRGVGRGV